MDLKIPWQRPKHNLHKGSGRCVTRRPFSLLPNWSNLELDEVKSTQPPIQYSHADNGAIDNFTSDVMGCVSEELHVLTVPGMAVTHIASDGDCRRCNNQRKRGSGRRTQLRSFNLTISLPEPAPIPTPQPTPASVPSPHPSPLASPGVFLLALLPPPDINMPLSAGSMGAVNSYPMRCCATPMEGVPERMVLRSTQKTPSGRARSSYSWPTPMEGVLERPLLVTTRRARPILSPLPVLDTPVEGVPEKGMPFKGTPVPAMRALVQSPTIRNGGHGHDSNESVEQSEHNPDPVLHQDVSAQAGSGLPVRDSASPENLQAATPAAHGIQHQQEAQVQTGISLQGGYITPAAGSPVLAGVIPRVSDDSDGNGGGQIRDGRSDSPNSTEPDGHGQGTSHAEGNDEELAAPDSSPSSSQSPVSVGDIEPLRLGDDDVHSVQLWQEEGGQVEAGAHEAGSEEAVEAHTEGERGREEEVAEEEGIEEDIGMGQGDDEGLEEHMPAEDNQSVDPDEDHDPGDLPDPEQGEQEELLQQQEEQRPRSAGPSKSSTRKRGRARVLGGDADVECLDAGRKTPGRYGDDEHEELVTGGHMGQGEGAEQPKAEPKRGGARARKSESTLRSRKSLSGAGLVLDEEQGVRRSSRASIRPLEYWRNEHKVYGRQHRTMPTVVGVETRTPNPAWPMQSTGHVTKKTKPRTKRTKTGAA